MPYAGQHQFNYVGGDYYGAGDYYAAGGLFSFLGGVARKVGGAVLGAVKSTPIGAAAGAVLGGITGAAMPRPPAGITLTQAAASAPRLTPSAPSAPGAVPVPTMMGAVQRALPGGATGYGQCPPGYHLNKAYARYLRAVEQGRNVKPPTIVNMCVKHRSMNPLNPKAIRRAVRREQSMTKVMRRVLKGTGITIGRRTVHRKTTRRR